MIQSEPAAVPYALTVGPATPADQDVVSEERCPPAESDREEKTALRREDKPWGYELLLAHTESYAGKILCIRAGHRLSLQHHAAKDETLFLLEGETDLELETQSRELVRERMAPDQSYRIRAGRRHRLAALTDSRVLEVSTPELEDVVRLEDDYGRSDAPVSLFALPRPMP